MKEKIHFLKIKILENLQKYDSTTGKQKVSLIFSLKITQQVTEVRVTVATLFILIGAA